MTYEVGDAVDVYDPDLRFWVPGHIEGFNELQTNEGPVSVIVVRAVGDPMMKGMPNLYAIVEENAGYGLRPADRPSSASPEEQLIRQEHAGHVGSGNKVWHAECLATDCTWSDYGEGGMEEGIAAHETHIRLLLREAP